MGEIGGLGEIQTGRQILPTRPTETGSLPIRGNPTDSPARTIRRPTPIDIGDGSDDPQDEQERDVTDLPPPRPPMAGDPIDSTMPVEPPPDTVTGPGPAPSTSDPQTTEEPAQRNPRPGPVMAAPDPSEMATTDPVRVGPTGTNPFGPTAPVQVGGPEPIGSPAPPQPSLPRLDPANPVGPGDPRDRDFGGTQKPETFAVPVEQKVPGDPAQRFLSFLETSKGTQARDAVLQLMIEQGIPRRVATVLSYPFLNFVLSLSAFQQRRTQTQAQHLQRAAQNLQNVIQQDIPRIG